MLKIWVGVAGLLVSLSAVRNSLALDAATPTHIPLRRSSQLLRSPAGINTSLPRDPFLPASERWWTRMFDAGIKYVRIGQYEDTSDQTGWDWVEQKKGQMHVGAEVDAYVDSLVANGTTIELQLLYGNPIYTSQAGVLPTEITPTSASVHAGDRGLHSIFWPPVSPPQINAFLAYTKFMAEHFRGRVGYYSLWNEPDIGYWNPYPSPQAYGRLLRGFVTTIRQADPKARIVAGGLADRKIDYMQQVLAACQCVADLDVVSYHIYPGGFASNTPPEQMDSDANGNRTAAAFRNAIKAYPGIRKDLQFWNNEYNSVTGYSPEMDQAIQAKYVPRAIVYNWAQSVPTFVWELINDTNTNEGNDFGMINGRMLGPTDFQPKPVYYAIERTNALFGDTSPDPALSFKLVDATTRSQNAPFFAYGFKSTSGKSIFAYWLGSQSRVGHPQSPIDIDISLGESGIAHPVLIDLDSDLITPVSWSDAEKQTLRVPLRDSVMAIADASYFDWAVLPEVPGGLTATRKGASIELKWQAAGDEASEIILQAQPASSTSWVDVAHLSGSTTRYELVSPAAHAYTSYRICARSKQGTSGYAPVVSIAATP